MTDYILLNSDELYHYGVPGMKWGHRKAAQYYTKKANRARSMANYETAQRKKVVSSGNYNPANIQKSKAFSSNQYAKANKYQAKANAHKKAAQNTPEAKSDRKEKAKKAAKVGAAVAVAALSAYGGYKLGKYVRKSMDSKAYDRAYDFVAKQTRREAAGLESWKKNMIDNNGNGAKVMSAYSKTKYGSYHYDDSKGYGYKSDNLNYNDMVKLGRSLKKKH